MKKKAIIYGAIFFLIDLVSKILVIKLLHDKLVIFPFLSFNKVSNSGAAFSMFAGGRVFFIIFAIFIVIYMYKYLLDKISNKFELVSYSFLLGGIIGNLFDRLFYGEVIDFISFNLFGYMFPIFNLADSFIVVGAIMFIIILIKGDKNEVSGKRK